MLDFIGNNKALKSLRTLIDMPFLLLVGQKGIGKRTALFYTIKHKYCFDKKPLFDNECTCNSCRMIDNNNHPDIKFFNFTYSTTIEDVSSFISNSFKPSYIDKRYFIIDFQDKPSNLILNSLLKKLEEPLPHATIVIITPSEDYIIPTIVSRGIKIEFTSLTTDELTQRIINDVQCSQTEAKTIAMYAGALDLINNIDNLKKDLVEPIENIQGVLKSQGLQSYKDFSQLSKILYDYPKFGFKVAVETLVRILMNRETSDKINPIFENFEDENNKCKILSFSKTLIENSVVCTENSKINKPLKLEISLMQI